MSNWRWTGGGGENSAKINRLPAAWLGGIRQLQPVLAEHSSHALFLPPLSLWLDKRPRKIALCSSLTNFQCPQTVVIVVVAVVRSKTATLWIVLVTFEVLPHGKYAKHCGTVQRDESRISSSKLFDDRPERQPNWVVPHRFAKHKMALNKRKP